MTISKQSSGELRARVNTCLTKLSDRDTLPMATAELDAIAKTLPTDSFAPFLSCLSSTDPSSDKSPVRRHCVRLLSVLSAAHGHALSPHVPRMISALLRRLRDPDSAVRSACVDAVACIAAHVDHSDALVRPLVDALFQEQDANAQVGAAMCLSAAAREVDAPEELRRVLPRVLKLVRSDCFKAKPSLLGFVCSVVGAGCVRNKSLLGSVVSTAVEFLSSDDWAARKAAAEVLERVAGGSYAVVEFKDSCVGALESRRFDKVRHVRETMNRALEMWKNVPVLPEEALSSPDVTSSTERLPDLVSRSRHDNNGFRTPEPKKMMPARSPASSCSSTSSSQKTTAIKNEDNKPSTTSATNKLCIPGATKLSLKKNLRSRVVPFDFSNDIKGMGDGDGVKENFNGNDKEFEDLSLIRKQLLQIEHQQSSLLELLQRFMGSSQRGMSSLEKRVDGLERVLDEMSHNLGTISTRRLSNPTDPEGNTCCMIPGAEFLSPKFWRKADGGQTINSKSSSPFRSPQYLHSDSSFEIAKLGSPRN